MEKNHNNIQTNDPYTLQKLTNQSKHIDSLINQLLTHKNIQDHHQLTLLKVKDYIKKLLKYVKAIDEKISRKDSKIKQLETQLETKNYQIQSLNLAKQQIQKSVAQIVKFNSQYLQMINAKNSQIRELQQAGLAQFAAKQQNYFGLKQEVEVFFPKLPMQSLVQSRGSNDLDRNNNKLSDKFYKNCIQKVENKQKHSSSSKNLLQKVKLYIRDTKDKFRKQDRFFSRQNSARDV